MHETFLKFHKLADLVQNPITDPREFEEACEIVRDHNVFFDNGRGHMSIVTWCLVVNPELFTYMIGHRFLALERENLVSSIVFYDKPWALELVLARPELDVENLSDIVRFSIKFSKSHLLEMALEHPLFEIHAYDLGFAWTVNNNPKFLELLLDFPGTSYTDLVSRKSIYFTNLNIKLDLPAKMDHRPCIVFILLVCLCDRYLEIPPSSSSSSSSSSSFQIHRFMRIGMSLPLELQMLLANHVYHVPKTAIRASSVNRVLKFMLQRGIL
jgi:hypothetical protein